VESPDISVVIATHSRAAHLAPLVDALQQQQGAFEFEIVIVDDASTDHTWQELGRLAASAGRVVRPVRLERNAGAATARNVGWRTAAAPLIAFTDDDCVPEAGWLQALVHALGSYDLVQGRTLPNPSQLDRLGPFARTIHVTGERGYYETCNMGYRRAVLESVGGFDERFRFPYGEDWDLAWRVKEIGGRSTFAPDALVYHEVWPSDYRAYLRDKFRREGLVLTLKKHPALRAQRGVFSNGTHPAALAAAGAGLAALLAPGRSTATVALAAGGAYAWNCRRYHPGPGPARRKHWAYVVPLHLLADLFEVGVLASASLRHRTLVL
jgi:GT2 family glycosyltransferase